MTAEAFRDLLAQAREKSFLVARRGIEKEGLRVSRDTHRISQQAHPQRWDQHSPTALSQQITQKLYSNS